MRRSRVSAISTPSSTGKRPAREAGARAAGDERRAAAVAGAHDLPHLLGRAREHDRGGHDRVLQQPVRLVGAELMLVGEDVLVAGDPAQLGHDVHPVHPVTLRCASCAPSTSARRTSRSRCCSGWRPATTGRRWWSPDPTGRKGRGRKVGSAAGGGGRTRARPRAVQPDSVNDEEARERIAAAEPEAVVICAFGALIKEPLLSEHEMLNVHPSLLPRWRGAAPVERAIEAGDEETGVSIMRPDGRARRRAGVPSARRARPAGRRLRRRWRRGSRSWAAGCSSRRSTRCPSRGPSRRRGSPTRTRSRRPTGGSTRERTGGRARAARARAQPAHRHLARAARRASASACGGRALTDDAAPDPGVLREEDGRLDPGALRRARWSCSRSNHPANVRWTLHRGCAVMRAQLR